MVAAGSASQPKFTATALTPDSTFTGAKSTSGALAQTDPSLLGTDRLEPGQRDDQVRLRRDRVVHRRRRGPRGDEPVRHRQDAEGQQGRRARRTSSTPTRSRTRSPPRSRRPCRTRRSTQTYQTAYGGVAAKVPANSVADLLKVDGVAAVQQDTLEQPQDDNTEFIGATAVWPSLGGSGHGRLERHRRRDRHRRLARAPDAVAHGHRSPTPAGGLEGCQFGDGSDVAHLGPTFACNNKLIGAYAFTATYMANVGAGRGRSSATTRPTCARRATPRVTARTRLTTAAGDCVTSRRALRRRPRPGLRHRSRRARDRVPRLPRAGLLRLRLGVAPCSRRSSTAST